MHSRYSFSAMLLRLLPLLCLVFATTSAPAQETPAQDAAFEAAQRAYGLGRQALDAGRHEEAVRAFERAAELAPNESSIYLLLGIARSSLKDWDGALEAYEKVLELDPRNAGAHNNIGNVHLRRGNYERALESYRRALELDDTYLLAAFHVGWVARQLQHMEEAESAFALCLSLLAKTETDRARQLDARFYLGSLRFRTRDYHSAAELMEEVLVENPEHGEAHYYLGQAYLRLSRLDEGRRHLELHRELVEARDVKVPVASSDPP